MFSFQVKRLKGLGYGILRYFGPFKIALEMKETSK